MFLLEHITHNQPDSFALIENLDGSLEVFWDLETSHSECPKGQAVVYYNDFLLSSSKPFYGFKHRSKIHPDQRQELTQKINGNYNLDLDWLAPEVEGFKNTYDYFCSLLESKQISKAVPICIQRTRALTIDKSRLVQALLPAIIKGSKGLYSYTICLPNTLVLGASPEILFNLNVSNASLVTEAVAGSLLNSNQTLADANAKLRQEHSLVAEDLSAMLSCFGKLKSSQLELKKLNSLSHLITRIELDLIEPNLLADSNSFSASLLIERLHPSGSLGILPRSPNLLQKLDASGSRGCFGAPFGYIDSDGSAQILVAIRNLIYASAQLYLAAGVGITKDSNWAEELLEIGSKHQAVKEFFSL